MDLLQLKYFCAIVEEGHMTRAAARLSIAQPALSASLGRLEKELGVSLFDRVGRNIYLNECGQSFYAFVSPPWPSWKMPPAPWTTSNSSAWTIWSSAP